jgi:hypothetical protein
MTANIRFSKDKDILSASFEVRLKNLTSAEQVVLECEWTDYLQRIVDLGNTAILKNFRYKLEMEEKE